MRLFRYQASPVVGLHGLHGACFAVMLFAALAKVAAPADDVILCSGKSELFEQIKLTETR